MNQKDIYRSANHLIDEYGADAAALAARRVQEMTARGDIVGAGTWRRILSAIGKLHGIGGPTKH